MLTPRSQFTLESSLRVVHSVALDKCIMTRMHFYIVKQHFLKVSVASSSKSSYPLLLCAQPGLEYSGLPCNHHLRISSLLALFCKIHSPADIYTRVYIQCMNSHLSALKPPQTELQTFQKWLLQPHPLWLLPPLLRLPFIFPFSHCALTCC